MKLLPFALLVTVTGLFAQTAARGSRGNAVSQNCIRSRLQYKRMILQPQVAAAAKIVIDFSVDERGCSDWTL